MDQCGRRSTRRPRAPLSTAQVKELGENVFGSWEKNVTEQGEHKWDKWDPEKHGWQGKTDWSLWTRIARE